MLNSILLRRCVNHTAYSTPVYYPCERDREHPRREEGEAKAATVLLALGFSPLAVVVNTLLQMTMTQYNSPSLNCGLFWPRGRARSGDDGNNNAFFKVFWLQNPSDVTAEKETIYRKKIQYELKIFAYVRRSVCQTQFKQELP